MAGDPLYGSEVQNDSGLFPTTDIVQPFLNSPTTNAVPVTDNSDIMPVATDRDGDDVIDPALIDEYETLPTLHPAAEINNRHIDLPSFDQIAAASEAEKK